MTNATPTKLRTGAWGARTQGPVSKGDEIRITTRSGKSWTATVTEVVWTDGKVAVCATESSPKSAPAVAAAPRRRRFVPCGYPGCHPSHCDECDGEGANARW